MRVTYLGDRTSISTGVETLELVYGGVYELPDTPFFRRLPVLPVDAHQVALALGDRLLALNVFEVK